ncbi:MAG: cyclic nucleotide-binding domain-containing protein [Oligoflexia bacterium]|nr:cyclic nucleotide-binding domain-containing protein [Oligoflexia bacterium]MBF0365080.1 cyclic nucleotide-binding domain-containing protein [Oligoflexia bacterium]
MSKIVLKPKEKGLNSEGKSVNYNAGKLLIAENDNTRKMFIIVDGKVRVFKTYMGKKITLAILGQGEIFGEMSFFDSEPRSASVEALTEVEVIIIDGEGDARSKEIDTLPKWVMPVLKAAFGRFREVDHRLIILQSMYEFQKTHMRKDQVAQVIYTELLRYLRVLKVFYKNSYKGENSVDSKVLRKEFDEVLGKKYLTVSVFWRLLKDFDFVDNKQEDTEGILELKLDQIDAFSDYLLSEVKTERYMILGHSALGILRKIISNFDSIKKTSKGGKCYIITYEAANIHSTAFVAEAINELLEYSVLEAAEGLQDAFQLHYDQVYRIYTYQTILKSFDHTMVAPE